MVQKITRLALLVTVAALCPPMPCAQEATSSCRHDSAKQIPIAGVKGSIQNPCFVSPAGKVLAFTNFTTRYNIGHAVVKTVAATGGNPLKTLSPTTAQSVNLPGINGCWNSAKGLATYSSDIVDRDEIYTVPVTGGTASRITNRPGYLAFEPSFSPVLPDGSQWIVFESHLESHPDCCGELWKVRTDGSGLVRLTSGADDRQPEWSPDKIAFPDLGQIYNRLAKEGAKLNLGLVGYGCSGTGCFLDIASCDCCQSVVTT